MIFNKTNGSSKSTTTTTTNSSGGSSSNNTTYGGSGGDRYIWGQYDNPDDDINGSAYINGNVFVSSQGESDYDDDEDEEERDYDTDDDEDISDDLEPSYKFNTGNLDDIFITEKGNLYVEKKLLVDGDIETPEIYAKKTLFVPHPDTKAKTDIMELFKDWDIRIKQNRTDIDNIDERLTEDEVELGNTKGRVGTLESQMTNCHNKCESNSEEIDKIKDQLNDLDGDITNVGSSAITEQRVKELIEEIAGSKYGSENQPIVLCCGTLERDPNTFSTTKSYIFNGNKLDILKNDLAANKMWKVDGGVLEFTLPFETDNYWIYVNGVSVTQNLSAKTAKNNFYGSNSLNPSLSNKNDGAHWFEAYCRQAVDGKGEFLNRIYIREFHQGSSDNDTWHSTDWGTQNPNDTIQAVNIIVTGYARKK